MWNDFVQFHVFHYLARISWGIFTDGKLHEELKSLRYLTKMLQSFLRFWLLHPVPNISSLSCFLTELTGRRAQSLEMMQPARTARCKLSLFSKTKTQTCLVTRSTNIGSHPHDKILYSLMALNLILAVNRANLIKTRCSSLCMKMSLIVESFVLFFCKNSIFHNRTGISGS